MEKLNQCGAYDFFEPLYEILNKKLSPITEGKFFENSNSFSFCLDNDLRMHLKGTLESPLRKQLYFNLYITVRERNIKNLILLTL